MENVEGAHHDHHHYQSAQKQNQSHRRRHHGGLTLALPSSPRPLEGGGGAAPPVDRQGNGNGAGNLRRDDCWSEGATVTLIQSWGDRYLELNRGNLKQKHWQEVADAVNGRDNGSRVRKSDAQCKNRLDTLKKKYKLEKSKICSGAGLASEWPFFDRLDGLIGPSRKNQQAKLQPLNPPPQPLSGNKPPGEKRPAEEADPNAALENSESSRGVKDTPDTTESCPAGADAAADGRNYKKSRLPGSPLKDLARAILRFGEVYEKIETSKQQQLMDLEKQRMEFTKDLELQRMHLFMQTQLELAKMKHGKHGSTECLMSVQVEVE